MSHPESNLLIVNARAGAGRAVDEARAIGRKTTIESISFQELKDMSNEEAEHFLLPLTTLFVLGGDGSTFTLLNLLFQLQLQNQSFTDKLVVALGSGGENVVAKHMNTFSSNKVKVVSAVLEGNYEKKQLDYGLLHSDGNQELFFWNIHGGFSSTVLRNIEEQRALGVSDVKRRYKGALQALQQIEAEWEVIYSLNGGEPKSVFDFGVIAAQLPYWTSKMHLDVPAAAPALLHTIATLEDSGRGRYAYTTRLLLEVIAQTLGLPFQHALLKHTPLVQGDSLQIVSSPTSLAVDSEVTLYTSGILFVPQQRAHSGISIAQIAK